MASEPLQFQREYQQEKMPFKPGHVKSKLVMLGALFILGIVGACYFAFTTGVIANLSYCIKPYDSNDIPSSRVIDNKINGVYVSDRKPGSHFSHYLALRFYEDGLVIYAIIASGDIEKDWWKISKWFKDAYKSDYQYGTYEINGSEITFTTFIHGDTDPLLIEWEGSYSEEVLVLKFIEHWPTEKRTKTDEFNRLEVEQCPFTK